MEINNLESIKNRVMPVVFSEKSLYIMIDKCYSYVIKKEFVQIIK